MNIQKIQIILDKLNFENSLFRFSSSYHFRIIEILNNDYTWDPVYIGSQC